MRVSLPPPAARSLPAGAQPEPPEAGAQAPPLPRPRRPSAPCPPNTGLQPPAGKAQAAAAEPQPQPDMNHHQQQHQKPGEQQLSEPEDMEMEGKERLEQATQAAPAPLKAPGDPGSPPIPFTHCPPRPSSKLSGSQESAPGFFPT